MATSKRQTVKSKKVRAEGVLWSDEASTLNPRTGMRVSEMFDAYRKKPRTRMQAGSIAVTPEEDEAMDKIANNIQIGGDHYKDKVVQPWDAIIMWKMGFLDGNALKYLVRFRDKGGVEDLRKARHYIDKLIEVEELK